MSIFELPDFDGHEQVVFAADKRAGLRAVIAIHDTRLGPAMGGCRMQPYADGTAAATDALRLSRAMTYKNAMAGLPLGGGKVALIGDPRQGKTPQLFRALGRAIEALAGRYITAEDVGTTPEDMARVREATRYVAGLGSERGGRGDPSPMTALGVFVGIEASLLAVKGSPDIRGMTIALQGLGSVGWRLGERLAAAGARLVVSDVDPGRAASARKAWDARVVPPESIHAVEAEVFAPCALGDVIDARTVPELACRIVAGAANNQLASDAAGDALAGRGILYAPDYVINAGGIIKVWAEYFGQPAESVEPRVRGIASTLNEIFRRARETGEAPHRVADAIARARLNGQPAPALAS